MITLVRILRLKKRIVYFLKIKYEVRNFFYVLLFFCWEIKSWKIYVSICVEYVNVKSQITRADQSNK